MLITFCNHTWLYAKRIPSPLPIPAPCVGDKVATTVPTGISWTQERLCRLCGRVETHNHLDELLQVKYYKSL